MPEPVSLLLGGVLAWVSSGPRMYADYMEAWRSTCPRQSVWEDALADDLIQIENGRTLYQSLVTLTPRGRAILKSESYSGQRNEMSNIG